MFCLRKMTEEDEQIIMPMVKEFYHSDAVDHAVDEKILKRTFRDAAGDCPLLWGVVLQEDTEVIGFAYLSQYYACEIGGINMMIEEVFFKEGYRGKGYGKKFFEWLIKEYPDVSRFRLEVTKENRGALALYKKLGFQFLSYDQMCLDVVCK